MHEPRSSTTSPTAPAGRPWPALAGLVVGVLLAHALLLTGLPLGMGTGDEGGSRVLTARQIVVPPAARPVPAPAVPKPPQRGQAAPTAPTSPAPAAAPSLAPKPEPKTEPRPEPKPEPASPAPVEVTAEVFPPAPEPPASAPPAAAEAAAAVAAAPSAGPAVAGGSDAPPVYATRLPPAATLSYELRRGLLTGQGELSWRPGADGYEMQIQGVAFGMPLLGWVSRGGYDAAGLAPLRFVDQRRGRDVRAANFQRDKGLISWSGVSSEVPLAAGAQDRLSWMVQLAAVLQADPQRYAPGDRVQMQVAGARGDVDIWAFVVQAREAVDVVGARVPDTLHLQREPRKPFDTQVQVWLDPQRHHLPVRLKLSTAGGSDSLEFLLKP